MADALENEFQQVNKRQVAFSQEWDLAEFLKTMELDKHKNTIFPIRVSSNHWGMFVHFSELDCFINQAKKGNLTEKYNEEKANHQTTHTNYRNIAIDLVKEKRSAHQAATTLKKQALELKNDFLNQQNQTQILQTKI
ncbi:17315_t:CDS:2 [Gigaspora rosea]|nr:17315_t:CDS:2 [Gigaspora rosea]